MDAGEWRRRRAEFCHDWLKNRFLPSLRAAANSMDGRIEDPELERAFFTEVLWTWREQATLATRLIEGFEKAASPAAHVENWVAALPAPERTRWQWLAELTHALWLARWRVRASVSDASAALGAAEGAFGHLKAALAQNESDRTAVRRAIDLFADNLQELSRRVCSLPNGVERL